MFLATLIAGLVLGGTYALVAMGLTLQYGIARTMNLAYGETIVAAAFAALARPRRARRQPGPRAGADRARSASPSAG